MPDPIFDEIIPLSENGSAHLTIYPDGTSWLALRGKATQLRSGPHGSDLANVSLLLSKGMTAKRRAKMGREEVQID